MARVLGVNAVFHDPAAALVVDGVVVAAAEEERFSRRAHGKDAVPYSAWELPEQSMRWCLDRAGLRPADLDAVAYSYDPSLASPSGEDITSDGWEGLRTFYVRRAALFLSTALPGLDPDVVGYVPHHVSHAASAYLGAPFDRCAVLVADGRGERGSSLAGHAVDGRLSILATQDLPHSLGRLYEDATAHLGLRRSCDEDTVTALAAFGRPRHLDRLREAVRVTGDGGFAVGPVDWGALAPPGSGAAGPWTQAHADLASSVQVRLEEVLLELARWLHAATGETSLVMAGGVARNCVANARVASEGPFERVWVPPAPGDAGTALGAALHASQTLGDHPRPVVGAGLGRAWDDDAIEAWLRRAGVRYERPPDVADAVADALSRDALVAWFQGASEYGPGALGHRSLLADPRRAENVGRLHRVTERAQFHPVATMVPVARASALFDGVLPSPFLAFVHSVTPCWRDRIPAAVHVDGTARVQTVDPADEPVVARMLHGFERRTGIPVVVATSLHTGGRPRVDDPRDALECFGSAPIDVLALGPFVVRRSSPVRR